MLARACSLNQSSLRAWKSNSVFSSTVEVRGEGRGEGGRRRGKRERGEERRGEERRGRRRGKRKGEDGRGNEG